MDMNFDNLRHFYVENYSLGYINSGNGRSSIENRFVLISLIDYLTYKTKLKNPDTTHYSVIMKLSKNLGLPDNFIKGLAIVCEDFSYYCTEYPTFGLQGQDIIKEVVSILKSYMPF
jgi:hypothetical protein